ncbi:hypothetical protein [Gilvimarinus japonicus]|jgi:hypothetical protein|uniref:Uncharacterized protein n=1 Tax=Gilvimarinus japonicus TaxID=1796469 RepID=A0ABV7HRP7_9GAMM
MKKILIGIPAALVVFVVASKLYYTHQLDKGVQEAATSLKMVGVELDYKNAEVTLGGDIKVEGIFLQHPASYLSVSIDKVAITTGSIFSVHEVLNDLQHQFVPDELGLEFEGVRLPITLISDNAKDPLDLPRIGIPSCGGGSAIASNEWIDVGYSNIDLKVASFSYDIIGGGQQINIRFTNEVTDMYRAELNTEVSLGASSRSMSAIASSLSNATFLNFTLDYHDRGLNQKISSYCQTQSELQQDQLLSLQTQDWQDAWRLQGLEAGPKMLELYQTFLQSADSVTIKADAIGSVSATDFAIDSPFAIFNHFALSAQVNNRASVDLDIKKLPLDQAQSWKAEYIAAKTPVADKEIEINLHRDKKIYIDLDNLSRHVNQDLFVETKSGKTINGQLLALGEDDIQFQVTIGGGYIVRPIEYREISRVYRITKSKQ